MKAVGYKRALPIEDPEALLDVVVPEPTLGPNDLVVDVKAISVNPADTKFRRSTNPAPGGIKVLGWDAAGIVRAVGTDVTLFHPGDRVWYAGSITRAGTYAERHAVDERKRCPPASATRRLPRFRSQALLPGSFSSTGGHCSRPEFCTGNG